MLTGQIKSPDDIPEGDFRRTMPRFSKENFETNLELVRQVQELAKNKDCTPAQLAIACETQLPIQRPWAAVEANMDRYS